MKKIALGFVFSLVTFLCYGQATVPNRDEKIAFNNLMLLKYTGHSWRIADLSFEYIKNKIVVVQETLYTDKFGKMVPGNHCYTDVIAFHDPGTDKYYINGKVVDANNKDSVVFVRNHPEYGRPDTYKNLQAEIIVFLPKTKAGIQKELVAYNDAGTPGSSEIVKFDGLGRIIEKGWWKYKYNTNDMFIHMQEGGKVDEYAWHGNNLSYIKSYIDSGEGKPFFSADVEYVRIEERNADGLWTRLTMYVKDPNYENGEKTRRSIVRQFDTFAE